MVEIIKETRTRGNTLRPDITLPKDVWGNFKFIYSDKNIRDRIVSQLLQKQIDNKIIINPEIETSIIEKNKNKMQNSDYKKGILDKNSKVGSGFISQRIVAKVLGLKLENDCNCSINFGHPYDLYDENGYGKINVKSSQLQNNDIWHFNFINKYIPDTYVLICFDENRKHILHVWIIDSTDSLVFNKKAISIRNTSMGLKRLGLNKVDVKPYDDMLHQMSQKRKDTNGEGCILNSDDLCL